MNNKISRNILNVFLNKTKVGTLVLRPDKLVAFEYDIQYLRTGISISPFYLPLKSGVFTAKRDPFFGLFGVFNDSLPDGWGKLLTDRLLLEHKISLSKINIIDRLALIGKNGLGALTYQPDWEMIAGNNIYDLNKIANEVDLVLKNNYNGSIDDLHQKGGASGGARPKVFINIENEEWIVKFKSSIDPHNIGEIEYEYSQIARQCGVEMSETKLFEGKYFGTRRFDREGDNRYHVHSASGLLYASYRYPSLDYTDLIKAIFTLTKDIEEAYKMFRLMVFNVLTWNRDDHAKNFSFILKNDKWKLSPAYDLVLSSGFNFQHTTTINGNGTPNKKDIMEVAKLTSLNVKRVNLIFDEVYEKTRILSKYFKDYKG